MCPYSIVVESNGIVNVADSINPVYKCVPQQVPDMELQQVFNGLCLQVTPEREKVFYINSMYLYTFNVPGAG
jgi:hypothetical protein